MQKILQQTLQTQKNSINKKSVKTGEKEQEKNNKKSAEKIIIVDDIETKIQKILQKINYC